MNLNTSSISRSVRQRRARLLMVGCTLISLALTLACSRTPEKTASTAGNDPEQLLRQMSEKLAQAKKLSFKVTRKIDAALVEDRNVPELSLIHISEPTRL